MRHAADTAPSRFHLLCLLLLLCLAWLACGTSARAQSAAPTGLAASSAGGAGIYLTWSAVAGVQQYNVYRATTSGGPYTKIISGGYGPAQYDGGVTLGGRYYYVVTALSSGRESGYSNQASATWTGPAVATAASASPSPVTGKTAALSVLGTDAGGENTLTYTWQQRATAPYSAVPVTYSANGTNAAKNITATFTKAGSYGFTVLITDPTGGAAASSIVVTVNQTPTTLTVTPTTASVTSGGTQQFTAAVADQFGAAIASPPVTWSVPAAGTITTGGLFTAGATPGTYAVTATGGSAVGTATVTALPAVSSVSLSPASVTGGSPSTGTVTLNGPAPTGGAAVTLTSSSASATVPSGVTVPAGSSSATFTVGTSAVPSSTTATLSAAAGGATKTATLTVNPAANMPRFQITNITNGGTLSGDFVVNVAVYSGDLTLDDITLYVDGQSVDSNNIQQQPDGSYAVSLVLYTNNYSNGTHQVAVMDSLGNSDTRQVVFSNTIQSMACTPIFDLTPGETDTPQNCQVTANFTAPQQWQVAIQDYNGNTVQTFSGTGSNISVAWNGTNNQGAVVADGPYAVVITAGVAQTGAANANATATVSRPVAKDSIGDALVVIDQDLVIGGLPRANHYAGFIRSLLLTKVGTDFPSASNISVIVTSAASVNAYPAISNRINNQLRVPCNLVYFYGHGSSTVIPRYRIGNYFWYPYIPMGLTQSPPLVYYDVSSLTSGSSYGNYNDPPTLVWMDHCQSAGINPLNPDFRWTIPFGIDTTNGYEGAFLGFAGNIGPYGYQPTSLFSCFTAWRENLWTNLFQYGQNVQTAINNANNTPGQNFGPNRNPSGLARWYGTGVSSF